MKKLFDRLLSVMILTSVLLVAMIGCDDSSSDKKSIVTAPFVPVIGQIDGASIIVDHTAVDDFENIPQTYIDQVKSMVFNLVGQSHARSYIYGLEQLMVQDDNYAITSTWTDTLGDPPLPGDPVALRVLRTWKKSESYHSDSAGEENIYTDTAGIEELKSHLTALKNAGNQATVFGFGWCWDMSWHNTPSGSIYDTYNGIDFRWAGASEGGPQGDLMWGIDADDNTVTGNSINLQTYLAAIDQYNIHEPGTITMFTTGPADKYFGENGFQRYVKHEAIRKYVQDNPGKLLFDFAKILSYSNSGVQATESFTDRNSAVATYPVAHADNVDEYDGGQGSGHVSQQGCIRLGKAIWYMLARVAGWDGK